LKLRLGLILLAVASVWFSPNAQASNTSVIGAPVDSFALCQKNLKIIVDSSVEEGETVVETSCKRFEILNPETGDLEVRFQPAALIEGSPISSDEYQN